MDQYEICRISVGQNSLYGGHERCYAAEEVRIDINYSDHFKIDMRGEFNVSHRKK